MKRVKYSFYCGPNASHSFFISRKNSKEKLFFVGSSSNSGSSFLGNPKTQLSKVRSNPIMEVPFSKKIDMISCGGMHTLVLTDNNECYGCGSSSNYQLLVYLDEVFDPLLISSMAGLDSHKIIQVGCGHMHSVVLTQKGICFSFGNNADLQCCSESGSMDFYVTKPSKMVFKEGVRIKKISCGERFTFFLSLENVLYKSGVISEEEATGIPVVIDVGEKVSDMFAAAWHGMILGVSNRVFGIGRNEEDQLTNKVKGINTKDPVLLDWKEFNQGGVSNVAMGYNTSYVLMKDGRAFAFGEGNIGQCAKHRNNVPERKFDFPILMSDNVSQIIPGEDYVFLVKFDRSVWGCGKSFSGQCGIQSNKPLFKLQKIEGIKNVRMESGLKTISFTQVLTKKKYCDIIITCV